MSFSVASYNVLADAYLKREWYPRTPDALLAPAPRREALLAHLVELDADVLCLQEVEAEAFSAIASHLEPRGYRGFLARKGRSKPDGCATLYRGPALARESAARLEYQDAGREGPSGHVAQLVSLEHEAARVGIANTHLKWDPPGTPPGEQYGFQQAAQLLRESDRLLPGCAGWILCGDLNATPDGDAIGLIRSSGFEFAHAAVADGHTANTSGRPKTIDYLFFSNALRAEPMPLPKIRPDTALPGPGQPSDHVAISARFHWRH